MEIRVSLRFIPDPALLNSPRGRCEILGKFENLASKVSTEYDASKFEVVIIGSGIAAICMAVHLAHHCPELYNNSLIIGDSVTLGARFFNRCDVIGQTTLRSPYEHHVGIHTENECELIDYARFCWEYLTNLEKGQIRMAQSGNRSVVPLDVFEGHVRHLVNIYGVTTKHAVDRVKKVTWNGSFYSIQSSKATVYSKNVIIATGESTNNLITLEDNSNYILWDEINKIDLQFHKHKHLLISGAGLTSAYIIRRYLNESWKVYWYSRTGHHYQCADVNARYFRPEGRQEFQQADTAGKIAILDNQRKASIMFEFQNEIEQAIEKGYIQEIKSPDQIPADCIRIAAHGTIPEFPIGLVDNRTISEHFINVDNSCKIVGEEAGPAAYTVGAHSRFGLGPAARNIDGMRIACEIIVRDIRK